MAKSDFGLPFYVSAGSVTQATATKSSVAGATYYITDILVTPGTTAGTFVLATSVIGTNTLTTMWQGFVGTGVVLAQQFLEALTGSISGTITLVANGGGSASASISGYQIGAF